MVIDCKSLGAVGDGCSDDTAALQAAMDRAAAVSDAGHGAGQARVVLPAGTYRCGTLRIGSHTHLHLEAGPGI